MITLMQAKNLSYGTILYHTIKRNRDKTPQRWKVTGKPKVWKTRPEHVKIPVKRGLYGHGYLDHACLDLVCLTEQEAFNQ